MIPETFIIDIKHVIHFTRDEHKIPAANGAEAEVPV
jgi:hypothetical protein